MVAEFRRQEAGGGRPETRCCLPSTPLRNNRLRHACGPERQEFRERSGAADDAAAEGSEPKRGAGGNGRAAAAPSAKSSASGVERPATRPRKEASLSEGPEGTAAQRRPRAPRVPRAEGSGRRRGRARKRV